jgi:hypothetical protein
MFLQILAFFQNMLLCLADCKKSEIETLGLTESSFDAVLGSKIPIISVKIHVYSK